MDEESERKHYELLYLVQIAIRYHQRRMRFYDMADALTKAVSIISGAGTVATLVKDSKAIDPTVGIYLGVVVTVLATLSLVFAYASKARQHAEFTRKYCELEAELVGSVTFELLDLHKIDAKISALKGTEPPALAVPILECQNEWAKAKNRPDYIFPIPWYKRLIGQFLDVDVELRQAPLSEK